VKREAGVRGREGGSERESERESERASERERKRERERERARASERARKRGWGGNRVSKAMPRFCFVCALFRATRAVWAEHARAQSGC